MNNDEIKKYPRKYYFTQYDDVWVKKYKKLENILLSIWRKALSIDHIGSTSIPGMSAKPVIDVLITVNKMENFKEERGKMIELGFTCLENYIAPKSLNFYQTGGEDNKINNIHVCEIGSQHQRRFIIMRDYFRAHPGKAKIYSDLKQKNRDENPNNYVLYRNAKKEFLDREEQKAYQWFERLDFK